MENGYTDRNVKLEIYLTEPQGKLKNGKERETTNPLYRTARYN